MSKSGRLSRDDTAPSGTDVRTQRPVLFREGTLRPAPFAHCQDAAFVQEVKVDLLRSQLRFALRASGRGPGGFEHHSVRTVQDVGRTLVPSGSAPLPPVAVELSPEHVGVGVQEVDQLLPGLPLGMAFDGSERVHLCRASDISALMPVLSSLCRASGPPISLFAPKNDCGNPAKNSLPPSVPLHGKCPRLESGCAGAVKEVPPLGAGFFECCNHVVVHDSTPSMSQVQAGLRANHPSTLT